MNCLGQSLIFAPKTLSAKAEVGAFESKGCLKHFGAKIMDGLDSHPGDGDETVTIKLNAVDEAGYLHRREYKGPAMGPRNSCSMA